MRPTFMVAGLVLVLGLACTATEEVTPPEPVVVAPDPDPGGGKAGKRKGKAPGRKGPRGAAPPDPYVAEGVCPGECCAYNKVLVAETVTLWGGPNGRRQGELEKDETVEALTGEVHVHPVVATVKHAHTLESEDGDETVKAGDKIWVLDAGGEGWGHVWHDGGVFDAEILFAFTDDCADGEPAEMCWAVADKKPEEQIWWVKIEKKDGTVGWVDNTGDALKGFDGCG